MRRPRLQSCTTSSARWALAGRTSPPKDWLDFVEAQNDGYQTGPAIGEKVPDFALSDQRGQTRSLNDLMGPNGLLLVFSRSADW